MHEHRMDRGDNQMKRRRFLESGLERGLGTALAGWTGAELVTRTAHGEQRRKSAQVQTVLGPVDPAKLGVTLMHEHAPIVDWSELFETQPAPVEPVREKLLGTTLKQLNAFHESLAPGDGPGAVVETTPIRVGRYPHLLVDLARRSKVHIIASSGFWCEALAPQHPWAVRMSVAEQGARKMAKIYIREITQGMEDPSGKWGQKYTDIRAGIIKIGTSTYMRPSERVCHIAAAIASKETGCPITTHTTKGGGLEEAQLLLKHGASPQRTIIGHQGFQDDRQNDQAVEYHRQIAHLGCYVQFDRVGHEDYPVESQARQMKSLIDAGFVKQILTSHDHAPFYYPEFAMETKHADRWKAVDGDYGVVTTRLLTQLKELGVSEKQIRTILIENPRRVLAF